MASADEKRVFGSAKRTILYKLQQEFDRSPKGSIDELAFPIVQYINALPEYVTTSSCSGRVAIFSIPAVSGAEPEKAATETGGGDRAPATEEDGHMDSTKGKGRWLYVTHGPTSICTGELLDTMSKASEDDSTILKVEPFILHVQCQHIAAARKLMQIVMDAGFRESGIGIGSGGKIIVAVRSTANSLEVPLRFEGKAIASKEYLIDLIPVIGSRFALIHERREKFCSLLRGCFGAAVVLTAPVAVEPSAGGAGEASVRCHGCGAAFTSKNKLYMTHLVVDSPTGKKVCPAAACANAKTGSRVICTRCSREFPSRNALFKHLSACQAGGINADGGDGQAFLPPAVPLEPKDIAARARATSLAKGFLTRALRLQNSCQPTARSGALLWEPLPDEPLLHRYGHVACSISKGDVRLHVLFGGYAGIGTHARSNDVIVQTAGPQVWQVADKSHRGPCPRMKHAAASIQIGANESAMLVFGGHNGLSKPLQDCWLLRVGTGDAAGPLTVWVPVTIKNEACSPSPRWAHTITPFDTDALPADIVDKFAVRRGSQGVVVFGGRAVEESFGDCHLLVPMVDNDDNGIATMVWIVVAARGEAPCHRFGHAAAPLKFMGPHRTPRQAGILVHGGYAAPYLHGPHGCAVVETGSPLLNDVYVFDISTLKWTAVELCGEVYARMSHSMVPSGFVDDANMLLMIGGICSEPRFNHACMCQLIATEGEAGRWRLLSKRLRDNGAYGGVLSSEKSPSQLERAYTALERPHLPSLEERVPEGLIAWPLRAAFIADTLDGATVLKCFGGGGVAFAFGSHFSPSMATRLNPADHVVGQLRHELPRQESKSDDAHVLLVPPELAEDIRQTLRDAGFFDLTYVCGAATHEGRKMVAVPLTGECFNSLSAPSSDACSQLEQVAKLLREGICRLARVNLRRAAEKRAHADQHKAQLDAVRADIVRWFSAGSRDGEAVIRALDGPSGLPNHVEFLGGILLLPPQSLLHSLLQEGFLEFLKSFAEHFHVSRIARRMEISGDVARSSLMKIVYAKDSIPTYELPAQVVPCTSAPNPTEAASILSTINFTRGGWVRIRENHLEYALDVTRVMFSSGNISEKARMAKLPCRDETVVDLFAGIGYFTVPLLAHGGAAMVHACEWNSDAIACLAMNLVLNKVDVSRYRLWPGDNHQLAGSHVINSADRILLGLIPTSEASWATAMKLLKPQGGWLHVHMNKADHEIDAWVLYLERQLELLGEKAGKKYLVGVKHVEKVKSYAPHVWHVVADVLCTAK